MKHEQFELIFSLTAIAVLVRVSYELSKLNVTKEGLFPAEKQFTPGTPKQSPITLRQKELAEKAVRRYAEAQDKNWRNWVEAMFEAN